MNYVSSHIRTNVSSVIPRMTSNMAVCNYSPLYIKTVVILDLYKTKYESLFLTP